MKQEIKRKLEEYVSEQIDNLKYLDKSEDEFLGKEKQAVANINVLVDLLQKEDVNINNYEINNKKLDNENNKFISEHDLELDKLDLEKSKLQSNVELENRKNNINHEKNNEDVRLKETEISNDVNKTSKDIVISVVKIGVEVIAIALPIMHNNSWMKRGFKFEETGTYTSNTFKNMFSKFKPGR